MNRLLLASALDVTFQHKSIHFSAGVGMSNQLSFPRTTPSALQPQMPQQLTPSRPQQLPSQQEPGVPAFSPRQAAAANFMLSPDGLTRPFRGSMSSLHAQTGMSS